ncbi:hypothetical protein KC19_3G080300 [Ceratodon purpureus]|uniref:Uncharacterized protein n=1 Tax=Ceratodon purpureus TaxID=3225 RepID=A0A8T0IIJ8_CERPU|nr:hypothetical protein KC19_3G080300 [Ceratodon purpureus]
MKRGDYCEVRGLESGTDSDPEVDAEDPDDSARVQREHMLELYSGDHPGLKLAYEDWERTYGLLERRVRRGTAVAGFVRKEVWHLVGVFVVVEGVLLATVTQAQLLTCENWWVCFYLAFLASAVIVIPLVHRITAYWTVCARIRTLVLGMEVLARRIDDMKTLGPFECTFDDKTDDVVMREVLKKPGVSPTILRMAAITIAFLTFVFLLMLGIQIRCEGSMAIPQRLQIFLKFSPISLAP